VHESYTYSVTLDGDNCDGWLVTMPAFCLRVVAGATVTEAM